MTVRELIETLKMFDDDMKVVIGMQQRYGSDFAIAIRYDVKERTVRPFYGNNYNAIVITEGNQCGYVRYDSEDEDDDWD